MRWRRTLAAHIKGGIHSGLEAEIPAEFDIYRTFPAKPKKGLGWFFPQGGERGNGEWDIAVLAEVTPLIRRQPPSFVGSGPYQHFSGQDNHRESVSIWGVGTIIIGETILEPRDDRAMSGHWQRRGTEPWPSSVAPPTSRGEWDLIRPILADTARDKSKSSPISFLDKWSRCKRWRQECTNGENYWNQQKFTWFKITHYH